MTSDSPRGGAPGRFGSRRAGILLHPTALPGELGAELGSEAIRFLDSLASAGMTVWQVLPLGPAGERGSPYDGSSAFAGNRLLISVERLTEEGLLSGAPARTPSGLAGDEAAWREQMLTEAWHRFSTDAAAPLRGAFAEFRAGSPQQTWLADWALFAALKSRYGGSPWTDWPEPLARRSPEALAAAREELRSAVDFESFVQFLFFRQWAAIRDAARARGITILGDLPIYVAHDSADVWANRDLFDLAGDGSPISVSGVPPDYFSKTGQRWGTPLYRWDRAAAEGFRWWIDRFRANLRLADAVRIDHFRGFVYYWAVPARESTAAAGEWRPGPGRALFDAARAALGPLPFVAEDLGVITSDVEALRDELGLAGMKVLQFGFGRDDDPHLPHRHVPHSIAYTGTHDNDTSRGWFENAPPEERRRAADYLGAKEPDVAWAFIRGAFSSVAETAIVPMQDVLELGSRARFNTPGRAEGNWRWRLPSGSFSPELAGKLRRLALLTGRAPR